MNIRMIFNTLGRISIAEAILLLLPLLVCFIYGEATWFGFAVTAAIALVLGLLLCLCFRTKNSVIYAKEGFAIVGIVWVIMSLIGALPFTINKEIPNYIDALFETVSGFTTTGASILTDVEAMSHGGLFWRSFTHWIGGMGVLVFITAISPGASDRSSHILKAEMPGPIFGKLVPRLRDTAKILYLIYIVLTLLEIVLLKVFGMNWFESFVHSFGTAGTGGFGVKANSIGAYNPACQWIIAVFMLIFGVNFNLYYLVLIRRIKPALKSSELKVYLLIVAASTAIISVNVFSTLAATGGTVEETVRHSFFQVSSIMTTTGYSTTDFNLWPGLSKAIILTLMFIGGCAGSTAGGIKVSRVVILVKMIGKEFRRMLHPRSVASVKFEGKRLDETTTNNVGVYLAVYLACMVTAFLLISFEPFGFESNFTATVACFNNVGPGLAEVGPMGSYADYTGFSKLVLSFSMLLGRLEIFPLLLAISPSTWRR
ncbi:MAG: TrkH family potassium uptake protein [Clostridia bacterium]|nr:TrkH family potassium uptake protein [Clostridia bacterium]